MIRTHDQGPGLQHTLVDRAALAVLTAGCVQVLQQSPPGCKPTQARHSASDAAGCKPAESRYSASAGAGCSLRISTRRQRCAGCNSTQIDTNPPDAPADLPLATGEAGAKRLDGGQGARWLGRSSSTGPDAADTWAMAEVRTGRWRSRLRDPQGDLGYNVQPLGYRWTRMEA